MKQLDGVRICGCVVMLPLSRGLEVCVRSRLRQAFCVITQRLVQFRAQRVCRDSLLELLQGAVESTTTWYKLILSRTEIGESGAHTHTKKKKQLMNLAELVSYLANIRHFDKGFVSLSVLVQLQS